MAYINKFEERQIDAQDFQEVARNYSWPDKTILIVEDDNFTNILFKEILSPTKINILWAKEGRQAVEVFKKFSEIDIVLIDLHLPIMDGFDAAMQMRALKPEIPIIAQSANIPEYETKIMSDIQFAYVLSKPFTAQVLLNILTHFIPKDKKSK